MIRFVLALVLFVGCISAAGTYVWAEGLLAYANDNDPEENGWEPEDGDDSEEEDTEEANT